MRTRVKFCGMMGWEDVALARAAGAEYFGMIFGPSPRRITWAAAAAIANRLDGAIEPVAVFVDPQIGDIERVLTLFPHARVQLSGRESPSFVSAVEAPTIKAIHVGPDDDAARVARVCRRYAGSDILFDTLATGVAGGSGHAFNWNSVIPIASCRRVWVAGGLRPENVGECVRGVRPFGVDVRSGIETGGRKDPAKMRAFVNAVRESDAA